MAENYDHTDIEKSWSDRLLEMTWRLRKRDLSLHLGRTLSAENHEIHLCLSDLEMIRKNCGVNGDDRLYHQALDHFLRVRVEPAQAVLTTWMNGAKARVGDENISFNQVVTWCQEMADASARSVMTGEVRALCRFLRPFNHTTWKTLLDVLTEELDFQDYIAFCEEKRGVSLADAAAEAKSFLRVTRSSYHFLLPQLLNDHTGLSLEEASRFDGIYLMGLRYLDHYFPDDFDTETVCEFLYNAGHTQVLQSSRLIIHEKSEADVHPYCIPVAIPGEVHIVVGRINGWLDLESLFHELGHALTFLYTDPHSEPEDVEFFQSGGLTETFAFLFQKTCMSEGFLCEVAGLAPDTAALIAKVHDIKWLTLARRYAAKLLIEEGNFRNGGFQRGEHHYAETMARETGFSYDPETYFFDLMPDFYSVDYFQAFLGSAVLEDHLEKEYGRGWWQEGSAAHCLQSWWGDGIAFNASEFIREKTGYPVESNRFVKRYS
ncbi:MAG: hypothetical protein ABFS19_08775 [Thermodesulfobacteriota bacterium]